MTEAPGSIAGEGLIVTRDEGHGEIALFYGMASQRLRSRARTFGAALALVLILPYEIIDDKPQFLWQLTGELPPAGIVAAFAPIAASVAILVASRVAKRATTLALAVLVALAVAALCIRFGADASAWDVLPLPDSLTQHPLPALLALALAAAGGTLAFRAHARRAARIVVFVGLAAALLFYALPARGEAPLVTAIRALAQLPRIDSFGLQLGLLFLTVLALWPLGVALYGVRYAFRPAHREQPVFSAVALYGMPAILLMFVYRSLMGAQGGGGVLAALISIALLIALLGLVASAVEILGEASVLPPAVLFEVDGFGKPAKGPTLPRATAVALTVTAVLSAGQWILARPPRKGVEWNLAAPSADADELFGKRLRAWGDARMRWDSSVRTDSSAVGLVDVKSTGRELVAGARAQGPGLGAAVEALTREAGDLDLAGRRFYRLVGDVNEQCRASGVPYYVDPDVRLFQTTDGLRRHFYIRPYRIEKVHRFRAGGLDLAALHVRSFGALREGHLGLLGFSRDLQPFALVVLDELEPYGKDLSALAAASPPACAEAAQIDDTVRDVFASCGELVASIARQSPGGLLSPLTAGTERHELQHQLDGPHLPMASAVLRALAGYAEQGQRRVNRELSAYVAELSAGGPSPRLGLVHLLRFGLLAMRGTEHHVAVIAFEALSGRTLRGADGGVDRKALGHAFVELSAMGDDSLRSRAASAYEALFGARLPVFEAIP